MSGEGTAALFPELVRRATVGTGLDAESFDPGGWGPTDYATFSNLKIPVLDLFTGMHRDWHTAGDTADKVNYDGIDRISTFSTALVRNWPRLRGRHMTEVTTGKAQIESGRRRF